MPAPRICDGATRTFLGRVLGLGAPLFRLVLLFVAGVHGGDFCSSACLAVAARLRAFAVLLRVLYCLLGATMPLLASVQLEGGSWFAVVDDVVRPVFSVQVGGGS